MASWLPWLAEAAIIGWLVEPTSNHNQSQTVRRCQLSLLVCGRGFWTHSQLVMLVLGLGFEQLFF